MSSRRTLSRRTMLRGLLGGAAVTVSLPLLDIFLDDNGTALANGESLPPRFGLFYWGNGVHPERWVPKTEGPDWEASEQLAPLDGIRDRVTVVSGTGVKTPNIVPHASGAAGILSGAPLKMEGEDHTFSAPTIDQVIAESIGDATRFRSLEFGAAPRKGISYNGPHSRNPPETSPYRLFERIFGAGFRAPGDETEVDPSLGLRRSVLDAVMEDSRELRTRLGHSDRQRLDEHLAGVRAMETRLARLEEDPPMRAACSKPDAPEDSYPDIEGRPQIRAKNRAMCDIIAMALACDQTRVFSNILSDPVNNLLFEGASAGHHQLTHDEPGDQPQVHSIVVSLMEEFAYFVEALDRVPEGDGTLLDNCVLLGTSDVAYGRTHTVDDMPILLAGTAGGRLARGVHYRSASNENSSKVLLSIIRALGINRNEFGQKDGRVTESLSAIEV